MEKIETIEEFYKEKLNWVPESLGNDIGHFNVFHLEPYIGREARPIPYRRRDFFKITMIDGNFRINYADKVIDVKKHALLFSNPQIPYNWENTDSIKGGYFCIFTRAFFHRFSDIFSYDVFRPGAIPVFELSDEQAEEVKLSYERMFREIESDYMYKYDVLRTIVTELTHFALKLSPSANLNREQNGASKRISSLFLELLERQFPIDDAHDRMNLRSASDFANQLNIHVNHLNRAVKATTEKTTSQIITERVLLESKILLKGCSWNVSEIAYALGFTEVTHFNNFFKKHIRISPLKYRNV